MLETHNWEIMVEGGKLVIVVKPLKNTKNKKGE